MAMSRLARHSVAQRQSSKIFRSEESKLGKSTPQKWRFTDNKKPLCLQYTNPSYTRYTKKVAANLAKHKRNGTSVFSFLEKCRDKLLEWLFQVHVKILDFLLEPAEKLFPTEVTIRQQQLMLTQKPLTKTRSMEATRRVTMASRRTWSEVR